jgi:hypothetical protein
MNQQNFHIPSQFLPPGQEQEQQQEQQQQPYGTSPPPYNPTAYVSSQYAPPSTKQQQQFNNPVYNSNVPVAAATPYVAGNNNNNYMNNTDPALYHSLAETERLIIQQEIEYVEAAANIAANAMNVDALGRFGEQANRYNIFTDNGGKQFHVVETSNYLCRCCLRPNHELQLHVFLPPAQTQAKPDQKVMVLDRPWKCGYCCSCTDICQQEMKVYQGTYAQR